MRASLTLGLGMEGAAWVPKQSLVVGRGASRLSGATPCDRGPGQSA